MLDGGKNSKLQKKAGPFGAERGTFVLEKRPACSREHGGGATVAMPKGLWPRGGRGAGGRGELHGCVEGRGWHGACDPPGQGGGESAKKLSVIWT